MRIVVVSAHYPPELVSGGTLQPQRLARGLRARGHDVSVYAGSLAARAPLDTWTERDETGLAVRWVVTGPWIGWADDRNWDNPPVTADFSRWLAEVRPDVVHLHALQSLGAGLVPAARASGARVVVTMHDFWWCCARQFLVDRTLTPCSPVVDAGVCPCEVDHGWLRRRNAALRERLDAADLVLCPSVSAAAVMVANGLDPERLRVDENGLPNHPSPPFWRPLGAPGDARGRQNGGVRFLYAGGSNEMKGVHVLLDAARALVADRGGDGWHLAAYGADAYLARHPTEPAELGPVTVAPAFDPAEADAVFAAADVVVIPSVMRESHSLLTREALARGLPTIVTDSLGPEEVVHDGGNGLVVPTGDAGALAAALRRVVDEPGLLDRLRAGCRARPVAIRALHDQVGGLEAIFADLLDGPAEPEPGPPPLRRVVFVVGITGAPLRYRARLPAEALALVGVHCDVRPYRDPELPALTEEADVVCVYRVPATVQVLALLDHARSRGTPVLFDVDDLIFDPDLAAEIPALAILPPAEADLWLEGVHRYRTTMERCDGYVGSTAGLVEHAAAVAGLPTARFDNGVGLVLARRSDVAVRRPRRPGPPLIGYLSGTTTHDHDWAFVEPAVIDVLDRHPEARLALGGYLAESPALARFGDRVQRHDFLPWYELPELLRDLDVNLAPLAPGSRFNEAKSAIKWLEAALVETPTIASPTGPFKEAIDHGVNGLLAGTGPDWSAALDAVLGEAGLGRRLGRRARRDALLHWSPHLQGRRYRAILEEAFEWRGQARSGAASAWVPVVHDEPPEPSLLDPYADADPGAAADPGARRGDGAVPAGSATPPPAGPPAPGSETRIEALRRSRRERGLRVTLVAAVGRIRRAAVRRLEGRRLAARRQRAK